MIKFIKPENLDGAILIEELKAAGVSVAADLSRTIAPVIDGEGNLFLDIAATDKAKATQVVANHKG
jgi:hypothetical protein